MDMAKVGFNPFTTCDPPSLAGISAVKESRNSLEDCEANPEMDIIKTHAAAQVVAVQMAVPK